MDTSSVPLKQCNRKEKCIHPNSQDGWLPATSEFFYKNSRAKDKMFNACRECVKAEHKDWREMNPNYFVEYDAKRSVSQAAYKRDLRKSKPNWYHTKDRERYKGNRGEGQREYQRKRRQTAHWKTITTLYYSRPEVLNRYRIHASNRRARERALPNNLTVSQWGECLDYFKDCCAVCGRPAGLWHFIAADHWIPITDKRENNPGTVVGNMIPLCHPTEVGMGGCNLSKQNKDPIEWLISIYGEKAALPIIARIEAYFEWARTHDRRANERPETMADMVTAYGGADGIVR